MSAVFPGWLYQLEAWAYNLPRNVRRRMWEDELQYYNIKKSSNGSFYWFLEG